MRRDNCVYQQEILSTRDGGRDDPDRGKEGLRRAAGVRQISPKYLGRWGDGGEQTYKLRRYMLDTPSPILTKSYPDFGGETDIAQISRTVRRHRGEQTYKLRRPKLDTSWEIEQHRYSLKAILVLGVTQISPKYLERRGDRGEQTYKMRRYKLDTSWPTLLNGEG